MNLDRTFIAGRSSVMLGPVVRSFLERAGYRRVSDQPLVYRRGSLLGTWTSFRPSKWLAHATVGMRSVGVDRTEVSLQVDVNASGQSVTSDELRYWETELDAFERALTTGKIDDTLPGKAEAVGAEGESTVTAFIVHSAIGIAIAGILTYVVKKLLDG